MCKAGDKQTLRDIKTTRENSMEIHSLLGPGGGGEPLDTTNELFHWD